MRWRGYEGKDTGSPIESGMTERGTGAGGSKRPPHPSPLPRRGEGIDQAWRRLFRLCRVYANMSP